MLLEIKKSSLVSQREYSSHLREGEREKEECRCSEEIMTILFFSVVIIIIFILINEDWKNLSEITLGEKQNKYCENRF